jgi:hypothetical protein
MNRTSSLLEVQARQDIPSSSSLGVLLGWTVRVLLGALLAMSYLGAVVVFGWLFRWVQGRVLHGWWQRSPLRHRLPFDRFCRKLGPEAASLAPRWVLRQHFDPDEMYQEIHSPLPGGAPPGRLLRLVRITAFPFRSLWLNFRMGFLGLLATFLLAGWGGLLMTFSWEYGWNASFYKIDEVRHVGQVTGIAGAALFMLAMVYVPMAQVHLAVTGDFRAFFAFRFVWQLIQARLGSYVLFAGLFLVFATILENLKTIPGGLDDHVGFFSTASDRELWWMFQVYYLGCSLVLMLSLLATRLILLRLYTSAVLSVLRRGKVVREDLHPTLSGWLTRLELLPEPCRTEGRSRGTVAALARRVALLLLLLVVWFGFVAKVYVGEFFNYHPVVGFLNHPLIEVPCCNYTPAHLGRAGESTTSSQRAVAQRLAACLVRIEPVVIPPLRRKAGLLCGTGQGGRPLFSDHVAAQVQSFEELRQRRGRQGQRSIIADAIVGEIQLAQLAQQR